MATNSFVLLNRNSKIGQFFTPVEWAIRAINMGAYNIWLSGGTILDPTGGTGNFLEAFIVLAKQNSIEITDEMLSRLYMIEIDETLISHFKSRMDKVYKIKFPEKNLFNADFLTSSFEGEFSAIVGNPPWSNFTNLPEDYK
ncbi:MAG: N-6 DNA methylase, partial [Candidatus Cloacimonetes bacterium]|nr:N-6 DNA methylase [Candidatus Cloacimonadota bacterium]